MTLLLTLPYTSAIICLNNLHYTTFLLDSRNASYFYIHPLVYSCILTLYLYPTLARNPRRKSFPLKVAADVSLRVNNIRFVTVAAVLNSGSFLAPK